jgi:hypothetical protein
LTRVELHPKDTEALDKTVGELRELHGPALRSVVLWGEVASTAYRPRRSLLTLAVVLDHVNAAALRAIVLHLRAWHRRRIPDPLLFDTDYLAAARDVFPLELLDLSDRHVLLFGEDPFASLHVDAVHLRREVEEQLRGKMLHLWEAYLAAGGRTSAVRALLLESPPGFEVALRGMLRLRDAPRPRAAKGVLASVEHTFALTLPVLRSLEEARTAAGQLPDGDPERLFERYLDEVRTLVRMVDSL